MPGGAQLVSDLLQGAFGSSNIDPDQAALASGYTHKKSVDDSGQPLDKPTYFNPSTGDVTADPLSKLPIKQPSFWQRAFAPGDAARTNAINSSFVAAPQSALQSDRTQGAIGARHTGLTQGLISSGIPLTQADPEAAYYATGGDPSITGINRGQTAADFYTSGGPAAQASSDIKAALAGGAVNTNVKTRADTEAANGTPQAEAENALTSAIANTSSNRGRIMNQPALNALTAKNISADTGNADIALATQPSRLSTAKSEAELAAGLAGKKLSMAPELQRTLGNQITAENFGSSYFPTPMPYGMKINPDGTIGQGSTGFPSSAMQQMQALQGGGKGISVTTKDGKTVNLPPPPVRMFDKDANVITPTVAKPLSDTESPEFKTDEQGNLWYKGHIIATAAQIKARNDESTQLLDQADQQNYDPTASGYLDK